MYSFSYIFKNIHSFWIHAIQSNFINTYIMKYCMIANSLNISKYQHLNLENQSMFKKYLCSCSSYTNVNIFSGKHIIGDYLHYSDRIIHFTFLSIHYTLQKKGKERQAGAELCQAEGKLRLIRLSLDLCFLWLTKLVITCQISLLV